MKNSSRNVVPLFGRREVVQMFDEMVRWLARHQVARRGDPREGAIFYPTENRHCNRDTACAAAMFMRQYRRTGDTRWRQRAGRARDYVLKVQLENGGFQELRGQENSDDGSAVNTGIVADNLINAYALGLDCKTRDLQALRRMADFELSLEWKRGAFYHDTNHMKAFGDWGPEGSKKDCQNTTALSAMMLRRIHSFLLARRCRVRREWPAAAGRAVRHLVECQMANGHWAYWVGVDWTDVGHHAMVIHHLSQAAKANARPPEPAVGATLVKGGRWLVDEGLQRTRKGSKIDWVVEQSACVYFTHGYFVCSAALGRLGAMDPDHRCYWHHEALELLRYVWTDLWNNPEVAREGPFRLTEAGIKIGYAWFGQSMAWCLYLLDDLMQQIGWWQPGDGPE